MCDVCNESGQVLRSVDTSFGSTVKASNWIPAASVKIVVAEGGQTARLESYNGLARGEDLYSDHAKIKAVMHYHASYIQLSPSPDSNLARFIGVRFEVKTEEVCSSIYKITQYSIFDFLKVSVGFSVLTMFYIDPNVY